MAVALARFQRKRIAIGSMLTQNAATVAVEGTCLQNDSARVAAGAIRSMKPAERNQPL
jgi:hypothetical protein